MAETKVMVPIYMTPTRKGELLKLAEVEKRTLSGFLGEVVIEAWLGGVGAEHDYQALEQKVARLEKERLRLQGLLNAKPMEEEVPEEYRDYVTGLVLFFEKGKREMVREVKRVLENFKVEYEAGGRNT